MMVVRCAIYGCLSSSNWDKERSSFCVCSRRLINKFLPLYGVSVLWQYPSLAVNKICVLAKVHNPRKICEVPIPRWPIVADCGQHGLLRSSGMYYGWTTMLTNSKCCRVAKYCNTTGKEVQEYQTIPKLLTSKCTTLYYRDMQLR